MATLIILSSVDRLPAWDDKAKGKAFGLNLSVALDGNVDSAWLQPDSAMRSILWPWAWKMPKVRVYKFDNARMPMKDGSGAVLPPVDVDLPVLDVGLAATVANIKDGLITKFADSAKSQSNFQWENPVNGATTPGQTSRLTGDGRRPWHTLVGKVSTFPYPVPQALNLSYFFYVNFGVEGTAQIFASPLLDADKPFPSVPASPQTPSADLTKDSGGKVFKSLYSNVPEIPVQAYSALCVIEPPTATVNFIDPATQWVGNPGGTNHFDEDWLANFEPRLADALDLSQFILRFMKDSAQRTLLETGENLRTCTRMALAAIADVAGPGVIPAPDGSVLIDKLLAAASKTPLSDTERTALNTAALYATPADQRALLKKVFEGQATYAILEPAPGRISVSQTIAEIESIRSRLPDAANLLKLAGLQWTALFTKAGLPGRLIDVPAMVDAASPALKVTLAAGQPDLRIRDLRRQMALSNLGRFWQDFVKCNKSGDKSGLALIAAGVPAFLAYYFAKRFALALPPWPPSLRVPTDPFTFSPPMNDVPATLGKAILDQIQSSYAGLVLKYLSPPAPGAKPDDDSRQPNETPHAITLQVDQLGAIPDSDKLSDLLNRFSGVGFLMRRSDTTDWLCLNQADLEGSKNTPIALDKPALVPWRVSYRNNLRQVCASYDNRPLVADSPLSRADVTSWASDDKAQFDVLMTLRYSPGAKMPGLTFGRTYQFAVFAIANSGAIPPSLTNRSNPFLLAPTLADPPGAKTPLVPPDLIRQVPYLRRVRIGAPKITDLADPTMAIKAPMVPDNVEPRARDLAVFLDQGAADTNTPVILLAPKEWIGGVSEVEGIVSRPGTHWDCWHRWVRESVDAATQGKIIAEFLRSAQKNASGPLDEVKLPLTVDDPALAPWFCFKLQIVDDATGTLRDVGQPLFVKIAESLGDTMSSRRAPGTPFTLRYFDPKNPAPPAPLAPRAEGAGQQAGATVTATKGKLYRLAIYCTMTPESKVRFMDGLIDPATTKNDLDGNNPYHLVSPTFFAIEAVTDEMPQEDAVYAALALSETTRANGRILADLAAVSPHLRRADLTRQAWRWQGRNTETHPAFLSASPLPQDILNWEAVEFGDRQDVDSTVVPMRTKPVAANGARSFNYLETLKTGKGEFDLRSLHFRFSVTVHSRYEGMIPPGVASFVTGTTTMPAAPVVRPNLRLAASPAPPSFKSVWNRLFIPCRRTTDIHAPRLRLILPLTEAGMSKDPNASPGLLVVFDEPWHESGGLAERLEVSVALAADPTEAPSVPNDYKGKEKLPELKDYYVETGPDPIVGHQIPAVLTKSADPTTPAGLARVTFDRAGILGPVGHYFDPTNQAALFTATSFIIPPPRFSDDKPGTPDRRWYFAKLRFRRALMLNSVGDVATGPWSDPVWTQFLPDFSIFEQTSLLNAETAMIFANHVNPTTNVIEPDTSKMYLMSGKKPKHLEPMPSDHQSFSLYAVLTRRVFDIAGRPDQEQFLGLYSQDPGAGNGWSISDPATIKPSGLAAGYRVRILEVQRPKPWDGSTILWKELFGTSVDTDVAARIVRISEPIDSAPGSFGICEGN